MKILFKILISLLVILLLFFGILLVFANPILERVKPQILAQVSSAIDAQVEAKEIRAKVFPFPGFSLLGLVVDNKDGENLELQELSLEIALSPLFSKKVEITSVTVKGVKVPVVRLGNGEIEVAGINFAKKAKEAEEKKSKEGKASPAEIPTETPAGDSEEAPPLEIKIARANISDVSLSYKDVATGASYEVDDVVVTLNRSGNDTNFTAKITAGKDFISGSGSFSDEMGQKNIPLFKADLSFGIDSLVPYLAFAPDVDSKGLAEAGSIPGAVSLKHSKGSEGASVMDIVFGLTFAGQELKTKSIITNIEKPSVKSEIRFPSLVLQPLLDIFVPKDTPQYSGGLKELKCEIDSPDLEKKIDFSCGSEPSEIETVPFQFAALQGGLVKGNTQEFVLNEGKIVIGQGEVSVQASSKSAASGGDNRFSSKLGISKIQIADLIKLAPKEHRGVPVSGLLSSITATVEGIAGKKETTSGTFSAEINNFMIRGYNFMKDLFSTLDAVPALGLKIDEAIPGAYRKLITSEETRLEKLSAKGSINGETIKLASFLADGEGFKVKGEGVLAPKDIELDVDAILERELVSAIQEKKPKIERFKEQDGTVVFPATIRKKGDSKPVVIPDVNRILKQQAGEEIKRKAEKALDKIKPGLGGLFKR